MKTNNELLEIWKNHNKTYEGYWIYTDLPIDEKTRIFDLIQKQKNIQKEISKH